MLETLLWDCFEAPNRCEADGLSAAIRTVPSNTVVLAFRLDGQAFRVASGIEKGVCCDRLLLALQKSPDKESRLTLFLLEMKGRNHDHAVDQLAATLDALRTKLRENLSESSLKRTEFIAVIVSDRAQVSASRTADEKEFRRKYRAKLYTLPGQRARHEQRAPSVDLSDLLRSASM